MKKGTRWKCYGMKYREERERKKIKEKFFHSNEFNNFFTVYFLMIFLLSLSESQNCKYDMNKEKYRIYEFLGLDWSARTL